LVVVLPGPKRRRWIANACDDADAAYWLAVYDALTE